MKSALAVKRDDTWPPSGLEQVDRCPVCGWTDATLLYDGLRDRVFFCAPGTWKLYTCGRCRSCYLNPRPTPDTIGLAYATYFTHHVRERPDVEAMGTRRRWQRMLANGYRNWRYGTHEQPASGWGRMAACLLPRSRAIVDAEFRHLPRAAAGRRVLDIGCGEGAFLDRARAAGWRGVGIDPDPGAVASARKRELDVHCGTLDALNEPDGAFDIVTLCHVIEHVHDPAAVVKRVHGLLKPGGRIWIDTPNLDSSGHHAFKTAWLGLDPPRHLVLFTPSSLRELLQRAGFAQIKAISRFEVSDVSFAQGYRVSIGEDPFNETPTPFGVRMRGKLARWRARVNPATSEYLTLTATRP